MTSGRGSKASRAAALPATARRSAARLTAVQALYHIELSGAAPDAVISQFTDPESHAQMAGWQMKEPDPDLVGALVPGRARARERRQGALAVEEAQKMAEGLIGHVIESLTGFPAPPNSFVFARGCGVSVNRARIGELAPRRSEECQDQVHQKDHRSHRWLSQSFGKSRGLN